MSPPTGPSPPPPGRSGRGRVDPRFKRRWFSAIVVLGALALYAAFLEGGPSELDVAAEPEDDEPDTEDEPEDARASPGSPSEPGFDTITFAGTGPETLQPRIPDDQPAILIISHTGTGGFIIEASDGHGVNDLVIDTTGSYEGTRPANLVAAYRELDIRTDGMWTIEVLPLAGAQRAEDGHASGRGDEVLLIDGGGSGWFSHDGEASVVLAEYGALSVGANIVDGDGPHDVAITVSDDAEVLVITGDGGWEVTID